MARFLVTGGAGFIGCNLVRALLERGDDVRVIDDFSTGRRANLEDIKSRIEVIEGSILDFGRVRHAMESVDYCLHQAAVASVPRSIEDPLFSNRANVEGTLNVFLAARDVRVKRVVFASSSSVYGDPETMPVNESFPIDPISPYGASKAADELYARTFSLLYGLDIVALRYFNVFGPRQDPKSQYAAVIPIFINKMLAGEPPPIFGDGSQSRDFSYIDNVVQANLLACAHKKPLAGIYNIACGASTSLVQLVQLLNEVLGTSLSPKFLPPRAGDIRDSYADVSRARDAFGYAPVVGVKEGLESTVAWYGNGGSGGGT